MHKLYTKKWQAATMPPRRQKVITSVEMEVDGFHSLFLLVPRVRHPVSPLFAVQTHRPPLVIGYGSKITTRLFYYKDGGW